MSLGPFGATLVERPSKTESLWVHYLAYTRAFRLRMENSTSFYSVNKDGVGRTLPKVKSTKLGEETPNVVTTCWPDGTCFKSETYWLARASPVSSRPRTVYSKVYWIFSVYSEYWLVQEVPTR